MGMGILERKKPRKKIFVLMCFLFWVGSYLFVPTFSVYCQTSGASTAMIGIIASAYGLSQLVVRIPLGILSDRTGKRKIYIILFGFLTLMLASAGMAFFQNSWVLFFMRLLTGVASSVWVCCTVLFASYFAQEDQHKAISVLSLTSVAGPMVASLFCGIISEKLGASAPFLFTSAIAFIGLLLSFFITEEKREKPQANAMNLRQVSFGNRTLWAVSLISAIMQFVSAGAAMAYVPLLAKEIGATDTMLGLLTASMSAAGIPASLLAGTNFVKKAKQKNLLLWNMVITTLSCVFYPLAKTIWVLFVIQIAFGFARGILGAVCMSMSIQNVPNAQKGSAMGFYQAVYSLGLFLGPLVMGWVCERSGFSASFFVAAGCGFAGLMITMFMIQACPKTNKQSEKVSAER